MGSVCSKNMCGCHYWPATINSRTYGGNNCPFCSNQKVCAHNNLSVIHQNGIMEETNSVLMNLLHGLIK
jgi:hypothetical protein